MDFCYKGSKIAGKFLIYRVELKVLSLPFNERGGSLVPNLPCGVERALGQSFPESKTQFLIYRVELKANVIKPLRAIHVRVPNLPCGVESYTKAT